jgi:uncharacterized repeat protein (TIGR01451 family)
MGKEWPPTEVSSGWVRLETPALVYFDPDVVDGALSQVSIEGADEVAADGTSTIEVVITAKDKFGNLVPGVTTNLETSLSITVSPLNQVTDQAGEAHYLVSHDVPATVLISATVASFDVANSVTADFRGADLVIYKLGPAEETGGYPMTYNISVNNTDLLTAQNVLITDTLPMGMEFISQSSSYTFTQNGSKVVWEVDELFADGPPAI